MGANLYTNMSDTAMEYEQLAVKAPLRPTSDEMVPLVPQPPGKSPPARHSSRTMRRVHPLQSIPLPVMQLPAIETVSAGTNARSSPLISSQVEPQSAASPVGAVLYVDDDRVLRAALTKQLSACEVAAVITATDGSKGLAAMQRHEFDLVISDLEMPTMDGREMIMAFRAWEADENDRPRRQRVVCLTGSGKDRFSDEALLEAGFDEVLRKPITRAEVNALLHRG